MIGLAHTTNALRRNGTGARAGARAARAGGAIALLLALVTLAVPRPAAAQNDPMQLTDMAQQALRAYDELDFPRAQAILEQALKTAAAGGLDQGPPAAPLHLYLGMVLAAGLQRSAEASEQFKIARRLDPTITPPEGLFNPEVAALFAAAGPAAPARAAAPNEATTGDTDGAGQAGEAGSNANNAPPRPTAPPRRGRTRQLADADADADADGNTETKLEGGSSGGAARAYFVALGLGAGGGTAAGHIDMKGVAPNTAPGGFALSALGHVTLAGGYFWSRSLLLAIEARLQLVSGSTPHCDGSTCSDPSSFAAAALAKASYFVGDGPLKLFGTAGLGGGTIRQIVKLNGLPDCGRSGSQQCFDTVTGGPVLLAAGGGAAYDIGPIVLLGGLTANMGVPDFMLNIDLTIGAGLRF